MAYKILHTSQYYCKIYEFIGDQIGAFNLIGTIIDAKTNTKKEILSDTWVFKYPSVPSKLNSLYTNDSYNIVIFTEINLSDKSEELDIFIAKLDKIVETIGIPISYCISLSSSSKYIKPFIGLYSIIIDQNMLDGLDLSDLSFYCGNNTGRPVNWKYKRIGSEHIHINKLCDKSKTDLYFAFNCRIQFMIPEVLFCNLDINSINRNLFELIQRPYLNFDESINTIHGMEYIAKSINTYIETVKSPIMILFIGLPASGKTTLTNYILNNTIISSESWLSKDKISNKRLYNLKLETLLEKGNHIIVDNTNIKYDDRLFHISDARKYGYKIIGITIDTHADLINHLNMFRVSTGEKSLIPKVVYNTMLKHLKTNGINSTEFDLLLNYINQINPICDNYKEIYDLYI